MIDYIIIWDSLIERIKSPTFFRFQFLQILQISSRWSFQENTAVVSVFLFFIDQLNLCDTSPITPKGSSI